MEVITTSTSSSLYSFPFMGREDFPCLYQDVDVSAVVPLAGPAIASAPPLHESYFARLGTRQERVRRAACELPTGGSIEAEDSYLVAKLDDFEVRANLVNVVYLSRIRCVEPAEEQAVSHRALAQGLLGIACFGVKSTRSPEIAFRYLPPFRGKHALTPNDMRLQETAATSGELGRKVVDVTLALCTECNGARRNAIYPADRADNNEVYTTFLPFPIGLNDLQRRHPKTVEIPKKFNARVIKPLDLIKIKLLVFPRGIIICVGSKNADEMLDAMRRWLPEIVAARALTLPSVSQRRPKKKKKKKEPVMSKKRVFDLLD